MELWNYGIVELWSPSFSVYSVYSVVEKDNMPSNHGYSNCSCCNFIANPIVARKSKMGKKRSGGASPFFTRAF